MVNYRNSNKIIFFRLNSNLQSTLHWQANKNPKNKHKQPIPVKCVIALINKKEIQESVVDSFDRTNEKISENNYSAKHARIAGRQRSRNAKQRALTLFSSGMLRCVGYCNLGLTVRWVIKLQSLLSGPNTAALPSPSSAGQQQPTRHQASLELFIEQHPPSRQNNSFI